MPYKTIECECGEELEFFISRSEESGGQEHCDNCPRVMRFDSPPGEGVENIDFETEIGSLRQKE